MRPLHLGIGLSVVLHGLAVAYAVTHAPVHPDRALAAPPAPLALVEPTPIEIVFLPAPSPDPALPTSAVAAGSAPTVAPRSPRSISTGRSATESPRVVDRPPVDGPPAVDAPPTAGPPRQNPLAMRTGPQRPDPGYTAAYDLPPGAPPPPEVPPSGHLRPVGGGRQESDQDVFTVHVAEDGSVEIEDAADVEAHVLRIGRVPLPFIYGRFDVTDTLMRAKGLDPYAAKKLKILDETREERYEMGVAYRKKQYARTPQIVRKNLEVLFATKSDPAEVKQALFEMWDESIEGVEGSASEDAVGAGLAARKLVLGEILTRFPADSADAYTEQELAAFNRKRTSKGAFAPYAD